jgi:hypothetical protein
MSNKKFQLKQSNSHVGLHGEHKQLHARGKMIRIQTHRNNMRTGQIKFNNITTSLHLIGMCFDGTS